MVFAETTPTNRTEPPVEIKTHKIADIVSSNDLYPSNIRYSVDNVEELWQFVERGTDNYVYPGDFVKAGPDMGALGSEPRIRFEDKNLSFLLDIGNEKAYVKGPDCAAAGAALQLVSGHDYVVVYDEKRGMGVSVLKDGERIAIFKNGKYNYQPAKAKINTLSQFRTAVAEALEIYRIGLSELFKANNLETPQEEVIVRVSGALNRKFNKDISPIYQGGQPEIGKLLLPGQLTERFEDIGGQSQALATARSLVNKLRYPAIYETQGAKSPRGMLVVGPPGTGKTLLARIIASESGIPFYFVKGTDFAGEGLVGQTEKAAERVILTAKGIAEYYQTQVFLFLDEADLTLPNGRKYPRHEATGKVVSAWSQGIQGLLADERVTVIMATNDADNLDERIVSRMKVQIYMGLPDESGVKEILAIHSQRKTKEAGSELFSKNIDWDTVSQLAHKRGMSGRDIADALDVMADERGDALVSRIQLAIDSGKLRIEGRSLKEVIDGVAALIKEGRADLLPPGIVLPPVDTDTLMKAIAHAKKLHDDLPSKPKNKFPFEEIIANQRAQRSVIWPDNMPLNEV